MTAADRPTPSGTAIVVDEDAGSRVLMLRRHASLRFMGGFWVFPGGAVDADEIGRDSDAIRAAAAAASRELREEAALDVPAAGLLHFAHWITPSAARRRFDTHFFVGPAPRDQQARVASTESSDLAWIRLRDWPALAGNDAFPLTPPTLMVLRELAELLDRHGTLAALLAGAGGRPVRPVLPKLADDGHVVMPWSPEYESVAGEGIAWDSAAVRERAAWPARLRAPETLANRR